MQNIDIMTISSLCPSLSLQYAGDLVQPVHTPYALLFHHYIYFFASKATRNTFMSNPLKYLHQDQPRPSLPIRVAVTGPPKSGKTTG